MKGKYNGWIRLTVPETADLFNSKDTPLQMKYSWKKIDPESKKTSKLCSQFVRSIGGTKQANTTGMQSAKYTSMKRSVSQYNGFC